VGVFEQRRRTADLAAPPGHDVDGQRRQHQTEPDPGDV
jgi:hypothetical protein